MSTGKKPSWWLSYLLGLVTFALLVLDYRMPLTQGIHAGIALVLLIGWGLLSQRWANRQRDALRDEYQAKLRQDAQSGALPRTLRRSPVQINYLNTMAKYSAKGRYPR